MRGKPRLLISDDQLLMAQCLQHLLERAFAGVEIVERRQDLVDAVTKYVPHLFLFDPTPFLQGMELMHRIRTVSPATKLVILTVHRDPEYPLEAFRAGAAGYLLKCCSVSELITAIWQVLRGRSYLTPLVGQYLASGAMSFRRRRNATSLTSRQHQVLQLVAQGCTAKEIAVALNLSVKTAVFHKTAIMDRLGLYTTAELTRYALERGAV